VFCVISLTTFTLCSIGASSDILNEIRSLREELANDAIRNRRERLDCWHSNARTVYESKAFKNNLAKFYGCTRNSDNYLKCMLTGNFYPCEQVRASHLIKRSTDGNTMYLYGLQSHIDHVRNGLLLLEPIEQAFTRKDICFLYNALNNQMVAKVLSPILMNEVMQNVTPGQTFASIDGLVLQLPEGVFPYRRVLSMHAKFAYSRALHLGWISDTATPDTYFNISDNGLKEPLGLGLLTWQEVHQNIHKIVGSF